MSSSLRTIPTKVKVWNPRYWLLYFQWCKQSYNFPKEKSKAFGLLWATKFERTWHKLTHIKLVFMIKTCIKFLNRKKDFTLDFQHPFSYSFIEKKVIF